MTFAELAIKVLEEKGEPLTPNEIWQIAVSKGYDKDLTTKGKTPWSTLYAKLYIDARDRPDSPFVLAGERPKRFYLRNLPDPSEMKDFKAQTEEKPNTKKYEYLEKDLHPFMAYFASFYLKAYTKTIEHTKSERSKFGEWVHPDMVGCYFPIEDWKLEVLEFGSTIGNTGVKLFSFELKRELNLSNLREAFFQTVSNSSWAHEGYLVTSELSIDEEFNAELRRLSTSFGIGIIKLDIDDPDSSEIVFPARTTENLDWDTINKLTMNSDFTKFLKRVKNDISSKEIVKEQYDRVLDADALIKTIKDKS